MLTIQSDAAGTGSRVTRYPSRLIRRAQVHRRQFPWFLTLVCWAVDPLSANTRPPSLLDLVMAYQSPDDSNGLQWTHMVA
jgi:hypothetical protein